MAETFDDVRNRYEVEKRIRLVFDGFLRDVDLTGKGFLDAGCGTGEFTQMACARGGTTIALDIGARLVHKTLDRCRDAIGLVGDLARLPFPAGTFDYVMCTEVIEHTASPRDSLRELCRVLRPGGTLILTVPNRLWRFSLWIANALKARIYHGYEHWVSKRELERWLEECRMDVVQLVGFNIIPVTIPQLNWLLEVCDRLWQRCPGMMVNLGVVAMRRGEPAGSRELVHRGPHV
jgi:2-polyprenyl-6-hydroxyphenyl methylase/3-demethylubiquinone-9 3-methyltransferase